MSDGQSAKKWYQAIADWIKLNGGTYLANLVMQYGGAYVKSAIGGFLGVVAVAVFKWVVIPMIKRFKKHLKDEAIAKPILEAHEAIINKPGVTHEEVTTSEDNFFNRP